MIKLPTPPQFTGAFFKRLSRIACSMLMLLALATPLPAADMLYVSLDGDYIVSYDTTGNDGATIAASEAFFAGTNLSLSVGLRSIPRATSTQQITAAPSASLMHRVVT